MRVDAFNKISQLYPVNKPNKVAAQPKENQVDSLELSQTGKTYQVAKSAVVAAPDVRQDKVDALKEQLASGTYTIGGTEIAESLVNHYFDSKA